MISGSGIVVVLGIHLLKKKLNTRQDETFWVETNEKVKAFLSSGESAEFIECANVVLVALNA
jgi:uncharacterized membrane protein YqhA